MIFSSNFPNDTTTQGWQVVLKLEASCQAVNDFLGGTYAVLTSIKVLLQFKFLIFEGPLLTGQRNVEVQLVSVANPLNLGAWFKTRLICSTKYSYRVLNIRGRAQDSRSVVQNLQKCLSVWLGNGTKGFRLNLFVSLCR